MFLWENLTQPKAYSLFLQFSLLHCDLSSCSQYKSFQALNIQAPILPSVWPFLYQGPQSPTHHPSLPRNRHKQTYYILQSLFSPATVFVSEKVLQIHIRADCWAVTGLGSSLYPLFHWIPVPALWEADASWLLGSTRPLSLSPSTTPLSWWLGSTPSKSSWHLKTWTPIPSRNLLRWPC